MVYATARFSSTTGDCVSWASASYSAVMRVQSVSSGRRVALVEDEIDDLEHRREARGQLGPAGDFERDARLAQGPLGTDDPLGDGRLRHEERPRDLVGREPPEQPQRERDARLGR